jgi:hypothetical protein
MESTEQMTYAFRNSIPSVIKSCVYRELPNLAGITTYHIEPHHHTHISSRGFRNFDPSPYILQDSITSGVNIPSSISHPPIRFSRKHECHQSAAINNASIRDQTHRSIIHFRSDLKLNHDPSPAPCLTLAFLRSRIH